MWLLIIAHYIGDFVLQTPRMAAGKSKKLDVLFMHCLYYYLCVCAAFILLDVRRSGLSAAVYLGVLVSHFIVDYFTSRANVWLRDNKLERLFWLCVGFDQMVHMLCLWVAWALLGKP